MSSDKTWDVCVVFHASATVRVTAPSEDIAQRLAIGLLDVTGANEETTVGKLGGESVCWVMEVKS